MIANLEYLDAVKMVSIQDAANAVVRALRDQKSLLKLLQIKRSILPNGRNKIAKNDLNKVAVGMKEIWKKLEKCLCKLQENIMQLITVKRKEMSVHLIGIKEIQKKDALMTKQCIGLKKGNYLDLINAQNAKKIANHTHTMRIIQSLLMLFGFVQHVISIYIIQQNITLNDLARRPLKGMRKSEPLSKVVEGDPKRFPRLAIGHKSNRMWQAGGKARFIYLPPGYNNDPCMLRHTAGASFYQGQCIKSLSINYLRNFVVHLKPSVIDLKPYGESYGNKAQAEQYALAA